MDKHFSFEDFSKMNQELGDYIKEYEKISAEMIDYSQECQRYKELLNAVYKPYSGKFSGINLTDVPSCTGEELMNNKMELGLFFSFGNDLKQREKYIKSRIGIVPSQEKFRNLMTKIASVYNYYQECYIACEKQQNICENEIAHLGNMYENGYQRILKVTGCSQDIKWNQYEKVGTVSGNLFLADIPRPFDQVIRASRSILKKYFPTTFASDKLNVPYISKLTDPIHILYNYHNNQKSIAIAAIRTIVYQMLRMSPDYFMEIHLMDGENTGADLSEWNDLQKVREGNLYQLNRKVTGGRFQLARTYLSDSDISKGLKNLDEHMSAVANAMGSCNSLKEYNDRNDPDNEDSMGLIPYQMLLIQNFPYGFTDSDIALLDKMIKNGKQRGIFIIILNNLDRWAELNAKNNSYTKQAAKIEDKLTNKTVELLDPFNLNGEKGEAGSRRGYSVLRLMRESHDAYIQSLINVKNTREKQENGFDRVYKPDNYQYGTMDATNGLDMRFALNVRNQIMTYELGSAKSAHGLVSGGTGSGKSTLLHMLITSIIMNYTPDDVEIWMVDYKLTEFATYKTYTPPHIRFIGLSKTQDFSYAFIDKIMDEMNRRQEAIINADYQLKMSGGEGNITDFKSYREAMGKDAMRRLIVIVDEFHVMAQHAQIAPEYKEKLENLLSEARALGIIMLFSDQTIEAGLRGLSDKAKKQIHARIAMRNDYEELKATLANSSFEEIKPYLNLDTGEIVVQTVTRELDEEGNMKDIPHLERGKVIYINSSQRANVNQSIREYYDAENYVPDMFDDRIEEPVDWKEIAGYETEGEKFGKRSTRIYIGHPVDLKPSISFDLLQRKCNNIMLCSGYESQQYRVIRSVLESFSRQNDYEIIVMADSYAGVYEEYRQAMEDLHIKHFSVYDDLADICYQVNRLLGITRNRGNQKKYLILWLGLDNLADLFSEESYKKPEALVQMALGEDGDTKVAKKEQIGSSAAAELDDAFASFFGDFFSDTKTEQDEQEAEEVSEEEIYNACEDIARLIHIGPSRNVYNMVVYDSGMALKDFREVKITDFNHRIAFNMSENEAMEVVERYSLLRDMADNMALYFNGRSGRKFIPYWYGNN